MKGFFMKRIALLLVISALSANGMQELKCDIALTDETKQTMQQQILNVFKENKCEDDNKFYALNKVCLKKIVENKKHMSEENRFYAVLKSNSDFNEFWHHLQKPGANKKQKLIESTFDVVGVLLTSELKQRSQINYPGINDPEYKNFWPTVLERNKYIKIDEYTQKVYQEYLEAFYGAFQQITDLVKK